MTVIVVLMLGAAAGLFVQIVNDGVNHPNEVPWKIPAETLYTSHYPISIVGNAGFTNGNASDTGVIGGNGTESDPFIIADWDIMVFPGNGIWISDVDLHFIIRNCFVNGGFSAAIILSNCSNGTIQGCVCADHSYGIRLMSSSNITLVDNLCVGNGAWGIYLFSSDGNTLTNNTCGLNYVDGMYLDSSSNNTLKNNTCILNSGDGLWLDASDDNTLINNSLSENDADGMTLALSSRGNDISQNNILNDTGFGISIQSGSDNRIWNNTFIGNHGANSTFSSSHAQASDNGLDNWWNGTDSRGNWWSDWQSPDDLPPYGIVDVPYNISGSAGATDMYPLTAVQEIPEINVPAIVAIGLMGIIFVTMKTGRRRTR